MDIRGVTFYEDSAEPKSPTTSFATQNSRTIRSLQLRSTPPMTEDDKWAAAEALLGYNIVSEEPFGPSTRRWISRQLPDYYPAVPTSVNEFADPIHWASSIPEVSPVALPGGIDDLDRAKYACFRFKIYYERKLYNLWPDGYLPLIAQQGPLAIAPAKPDEGDALRRGWINTRFIIKQVRDASTTVSIPGGLFKYTDAINTRQRRASLHTSFPFQLHRARVTYQWISVPLLAIPFDAIRSCCGSVNAETFDGFSVDTLRFDTWSYDLETGPLGDLLANVTYAFTWLPNVDPETGNQIGHVGAPRTIDGKFRIVKVSTDGDPATADQDAKRPFRRNFFDRLFRPSQVGP